MEICKKSGTKPKRSECLANVSTPILSFLLSASQPRAFIGLLGANKTHVMEVLLLGVWDHSPVVTKQQSQRKKLCIKVGSTSLFPPLLTR